VIRTPRPSHVWNCFDFVITFTGNDVEEMSLLGEGRQMDIAMRFTTTTGVVAASDRERFERTLFRATRGNCFYEVWLQRERLYTAPFDHSYQSLNICHVIVYLHAFSSWTLTNLLSMERRAI
jgi:hypothetical protein